jgi:hypothetical protein
MRIPRYVVGGIVAVVLATIVLANAAPDGRRGILIESTAGTFVGDAKLDDQSVHHSIGFRLCRYFAGIGFFETIGGRSCPWLGVEDKEIQTIRSL